MESQTGISQAAGNDARMDIQKGSDNIDIIQNITPQKATSGTIGKNVNKTVYFCFNNS